MSKHKPLIEIGENYRPLNECGSIYNLSVYLASEKFQLLEKFLFTYTFPVWSPRDWRKVSQTFNYD